MEVPPRAEADGVERPGPAEAPLHHNGMPVWVGTEFNGIGTEQNIHRNAGRKAAVGWQNAQLGMDAVALRGSGKEVRFADEAGDEPGGWAVVDLFGSPDLFQPAMVEHSDAIGDLECLRLVVGDEDSSAPGPFEQAAEVRRELCAQIGVQAGKGLIQKDDGIAGRQRSGQRDTLLLTAR